MFKIPSPPCFLFLIDAAHKKWPSASRTPHSSFLFLIHFLSARPNYMEDKVIDKGESERPQQAARGPSLLSSLDPFPGYAGAAATRLDFSADIRPGPACSQSPNTGSALHFTPGGRQSDITGGGAGGCSGPQPTLVITSTPPVHSCLRGGNLCLRSRRLCQHEIMHETPCLPA